MKYRHLVILILFSVLSVNLFSAEKSEKQLEKEPVIVDAKFCDELMKKILKKNTDWKDTLVFEAEDEMVFRVRFYPPKLNDSKSNYASLFEIEVTDEDVEKAEKQAEIFSDTVNSAFSTLKDKPYVDHYVLDICRTFKSVDIKSAYFTKEADRPFTRKKDQVLFQGEFLVGERLEFIEAIEAIESGDREEGIEKLREFIKNNPDSPLVNDARMGISEALSDLAEDMKKDISPQLPDYGYKSKAAFEKIKTLIKMGKKKNAVSEIRSFRKKFPLSPLNEKLLAFKM